jgi:hypothetical protein
VVHPPEVRGPPAADRRGGSGSSSGSSQTRNALSTERAIS